MTKENNNPLALNNIIPVLEPLAKVIKVSKGEIIFNKDDFAESFFFILKGQVRLFKIDIDGRETEIKRLGPKHFFAEVMAFAGVAYPVSAQALADCTLWRFSTESIYKAMYHKLDIAIFFTHLLAERCLTLNKIIDSFTAQDLSVRLARYLLQFIADNNIRITKNKLTFDLPILKKDLANVLGTLPETLSRTFNKLHRQGLIKVFGKKIVVLNYEKLRQFA